MTSSTLAGFAWPLALFIAHVAVALRAMTRPNRAPASRIAWIAVIMLAPIIGLLAYLLFGETSIGEARIARVRRSEREIAPSPDEAFRPASLPPVAAPLFELAHTVNGFHAVGGNRITLLSAPDADVHEPMRDSKFAIDVLIAHIEQAQEQVHIAFYIWLDDHTGGRVAEAVAAAARRGVTCRVMVDALGSRDFIGGPLWRLMVAAGVECHATLADISRLRHLAFSRVDLRDHRKIVVIDNRFAFCGSQNCADPEFRIKAAYAPWVDLFLRCEGPVVRQMQRLFLSGWIPETGEQGLDALPTQLPIESFEPGCLVQSFETGATSEANAMSDMFVACIYAARHELIITTPYFVPDEPILRALCAAPRRGVRTVLILPARNDSWLVNQAARASYGDLLHNRVELHEYPCGLLHAKSMTIDGALTLVGSANIDRRSLELNYENNLLIADPAVTATIRARQLGYLSVSVAVDPARVRTGTLPRRLVENVVAMMSPLL